MPASTATVPRAFVTPSRWRRPGVRFRPIDASDREFLAALYASTREEELAVVPWTADAKRAFLRQQFELQHEHYHRHYGSADFLLISRDDVPIGRVYVYRTDLELRLMEIALVPQVRGQGLGAALLHELMDEARATNAQLTLHVEPNNPACRLYERLGFALVENRGVYLFLGWKPG